MSDSLDEVAIIGMAGRFPKARNINEFWKNLRDGVEAISFFTEEELAASGIAPEVFQNPHYVRGRAALEDVEDFDAAFFGFNAREAEIMDPQHRLFLECAWEALEDAGYDSEFFSGKIGVYAGESTNSYLLNNLIFNSELLSAVGAFQIMLGNDRNYLTTYTSYKLNLKGPSFTIQTACSTSLVAVHVACQSLLNGECDMVLAGGCSVNVPQKAGYFYREGGIASPDGHCRAFDAEAQGTVGGSGLGVVVLRRLSDALAEGDHIHAVIKGSAINNDGALKAGFTAPSVDAQAEVIAEALAMSGVEAETISYVEAHGTGTPLGDPIEIAALTKAFRETTQAEGFCAVGSVKTNIGHLDAAAGLAGLIKTILALKHKQLPPSLNFREPNPRIEFANSPFYVNDQLSYWKEGAAPRRAGVSSFGIGGTNAHVIVEEAPAVAPPVTSRRHWHLLTLSARTPAALEKVTDNLAGYLQQHPSQNLADVAFTLQAGRKAFNHRRLLVCRDQGDAVAALKTRDATRLFTAACDASERSIVFMFPGQGAQYVNMGRELYELEPVFREQVNICSELLHQHLEFDLRRVLFSDEAEATPARRLGQTYITQPALFVICYALARTWMAWGIRPQAMIGHSIGEYVAACLSGVLMLEDALALVATRGRLMQQLPEGAMLAVSLSESAVQPFLKAHTELSLAAVNAPKLCVISGPTNRIDVLQEELAAQGIGYRRLHTSHAFHSTMVEPIIRPFTEALRKVELKPLQIPYMSNVTGNWIGAEEAADSSYWSKHLRQTVRFADGLQKLLKESDRIFLDVGPGQTLSAIAAQISATSVKPTILASLSHPHKQQSDVSCMLTTLGKLWLNGARADWLGFHQDEIRHRLSLPTYPFERQRYWIDAKHVHARNLSNPQPEFSQTLSSSEPNGNSSFSYYSRPDLQNTYVAPGNELEIQLAEIWRELLGIEKVGVHDNFFALGGNSLTVTQVLARLQKRFPVEVSVRDLFNAPTIAELAIVVEELLIEKIGSLSEEEAQRLI